MPKERLMDNNDKMVDLNENNNGNHDLTNNQGVGAPCENGFAGKYPCKGIDLLAHINLSTFESYSGNILGVGPIPILKKNMC